MTRNLAKKGARLVASCLGLGSARFKILAYHSIAPASRDPFEISSRQFREQMDFLVAEDYQVISLEDAWRDLRTGRIRPNTVVITFDDGFRHLQDHAFPVLERYGFPATIFVPFAFVGGIDSFSYAHSRPDFEIMTLEEIVAALQLGISFGSHSMSHADLRRLSDAELAFELGESKRFLTHELGIGFSSLAYPFGLFDERVKQAVNSAGYDCALGFGNILGNSRYTALDEMKREKILVDTRLEDFRILLDVKNDLARKVRRHFASA